MKITIVMGPWFPVPPVRGGALAKAWYGLAREFATAGHEVTIMAKQFPGQPDHETVGGLRFIRTRGFSQGNSLAWDLAKDFLYALNVLPRLPLSDILVTNDFWVPALAANLRRRAGAVLVSAGRFPKGQYWLYRRVARIVAISYAVKAGIIAEQPGLTSRVVTIPLPVDLESLTVPASPDHGPGRTLLYVGRVHPEKGVELLVRAFAAIGRDHPDWHLRIVGPTAEADGGGGEKYLASIRGAARDLNVELLGPIFGRAALAAIYQSADLFCYPSLAETGEAFGIAPLESMAAGVPAVVSSLACFREFIRDGDNGWVFDHHGDNAEAALANVLATAMQDNDLRARAGERAREDARQFGFPAMAQRYLHEFEQVLANV